MVLPKIVVWFKYWQLIEGLDTSDRLLRVDQIPPHASYITALDATTYSPVLVANRLDWQETRKSAAFKLDNVLPISGRALRIDRNRPLKSL